MVVFGLGKNFLFKFMLGRCESEQKISYLLIFPGFPDNFGTGREWESDLEGSQVQVFDPVLLSLHTCNNKIEKY